MPEMPQLPPNAQVYKTTREFDEQTVPPALLRAHTTKVGTWARIVVREGTLRYALTDVPDAVWDLRPGTVGVVEPTVPHAVTPIGAVRFVVEFLSLPASS